MPSLLLIFCQAFAEESENIFRDSDRRSDLDKAYKMLSQRLFNEVARIASEHLKTPRHVIMLENFHRINGLLSLYVWLAKQHPLHMRKLFICFLTSQIRRTPYSNYRYMQFLHNHGNRMFSKPLLVQHHRYGNSKNPNAKVPYV